MSPDLTPGDVLGCIILGVFALAALAAVIWPPGRGR